MPTSRQETIHSRCHKREKSSEEELEQVDQLYASNFAEESPREQIQGVDRGAVKTETIFKITGTGQ